MDSHNPWKPNVVKSNKNESNDELLLRAKIHAQKQAHQKKLEEEQKKAQQFAIKVLKEWKTKNPIVINL
jgi:hypothetical protein